MHSWASHFFFSHEFLHMSSKIVHHARRILEKKDKEKRDESEKKRLWNQISKLQCDSENMLQMIKQQEDNTMQQLDIILQKLNRLCAD